MRRGRTLSQRLVLWGVLMTWAVGGAVGLEVAQSFNQLSRAEGEYGSWITFWFEIPDGLTGDAR